MCRCVVLYTCISRYTYNVTCACMLLRKGRPGVRGGQHTTWGIEQTLRTSIGGPHSRRPANLPVSVLTLLFECNKCRMYCFICTELLLDTMNHTGVKGRPRKFIYMKNHSEPLLSLTHSLTHSHTHTPSLSCRQGLRTTTKSHLSLIN